ncbi:MAG: protein kinase [Planctomycetota bacterium]
MPSPEESLHDDLLTPLHADDDGWLRLVQQAERGLEERMIGDYEVLDEIRSGGQALVFHARHRVSGREVALKRVAYGAFASPAERRRFEREVAATSTLQNPGIVTVYGTEQVAGVELLVMEWVRGRRLDEWAETGAEGDKVAFRNRLEMFLQVCDAVHHAHQNGVLHRDLKPSNVLVDEEGRCRVLDFGVARRFSVDGDTRSLDTLTCGFAGTPAYAPPEALDEESTRVDVRGDVFSLGVILYELLSGSRPFVGPGLRELLDQIAEHEPARLRTGPSSRQRDLDAILRTALSKRPERRYSTVLEFATDLRRYLEGRAVTAVPPTATYLARRWIGRNRAVFAAFCAMVALAVGSGVVFFIQRDEIIAERDAARTAKARADDALLETDAAREEAQQEARNARDVANFYLDLVRDAAPASPTATVDFFEVLLGATADVRARLAAAPHWVTEIEANTALWMIQRGQTDAALALARRSLELQEGLEEPIATTTSLLHRVIGESLARLGQNEEAAASLHLAVDELIHLDRWRKNRSVARLSLGRVLQQLQRTEEAEPVLREAIRDADDASSGDLAVGARAVLASVLLDLQRIEDAASTLRGAEERINDSVSDTSRWTLFNTQGELHTKREEPEKAVAAFQRSARLAERMMVESHPERALSLFRLGSALRAVGRIQDAESTLRRALELGLDGGELAIAHESVGLFLARRNEVARAAEHYEAAWTAFDRWLTPDNGRRIAAFASWLAVLIRADMLDEAREQYPKLLEQIRSCAELGGTAGAIYWQRVFAMGENLGLADSARTGLRAALQALRSSPIADYPAVLAIAEVVEGL